MNKELEEALYTAKERCEGNIILDEASMNGFEEIYPFTTENIAGYIDYFDLQDKSLLTVGSSGDQIINAAFKGAKDITLLDINPYAKYYYYLKAAGILELNLTDFNEFFRYNDYPKVFKYNKKVFDKASYKKLKSTLKSLDNDSYLFWDELFDMYQPDHIRFSLFSNDEYGTSVLGKSNLYLKSENTYDETKTKLKELRPEFINEDIFKSNLTKNYDNIWLSNIACYLYQDKIKGMTDKFADKLAVDGKLLISYLYSIDMNTEYDDDWSPIYDLKNDLELLKEYSPIFHFFKGVNGIKHNDDDIKDSVLIYQKKKDN
mgnify:FL=1